MNTSLSHEGAAMSPVSVPSAAASTGVRRTEMKAPTAFRTISEVATDLDVPQHVLRFWESKFQQIRPLKRGGGRRYYRPEDISLINNIKELLYTQGMTIRGVQKLLREGGRPQFARAPSTSPMEVAVEDSVNAIEAATAGHSMSAEKRREVENILVELKALRDFLRQSGV